MIARLWSARTSTSLSTKYMEHFWHSVAPSLRQIEGYVSASVLVRSQAELVEILVITVWKSYEAIDAFTGAKRDTAVVAGAAAELLTDYDRRVRHYEIAQVDGLTYAQP